MVVKESFTVTDQYVSVVCYFCLYVSCIMYSHPCLTKFSHLVGKLIIITICMFNLLNNSGIFRYGERMLPVDSAKALLKLYRV